LSPRRTNSVPSFPNARSQMYFDFGSKTILLAREPKPYKTFSSGDPVANKAHPLPSNAIDCTSKSVDSRKTIFGSAPSNRTPSRRSAHRNTHAVASVLQRPHITTIRMPPAAKNSRQLQVPIAAHATPCALDLENSCMWIAATARMLRQQGSGRCHQYAGHDEAIKSL